MKTWLIVGVLVAPLFAAQPLFAQNQGEGQPLDEGGLQEIVVTAQKRTENIQNVPISIIAFTGEDLKRLGMTEGFDLANQVPNMNIDKAFGDSNVRYFIRGVGTQDFNSLATSPIAVYIDDVFLGSTIANSVNMFDMERVEVLLGPQGTLWGKNTTGGAINFISAHPTQTLAATASGGFGNFGERDAEAMLNVPLTSYLAARAAVTYSGQNDWVTNLAPDGPHNLEAYNKVGGRLSFEWTPTDALTGYLKGEYLKRTGSTITPHMVPIMGNTDAFGDPLLPQDQVNQAGGPSSDDFQTWDGTLRFDWSLASFMKLISISAWQNAERINEYELDGGTPFLLFNGAFFANHDQFTQELRLESTSWSHFRWQAGLFYYYARESANTADPFNLSVFGGPPNYVTGDDWPETRKWNSDAVFGGAEYDFTPQLTAKGGLRYNSDEGSYHAVHYNFNPYANYLNYLNPNPLADANAVLIPGDTLNTRQNWSKLTWDAGLKYRFTDNKMAYVNASTGYRQGTFNTPTSAAAQFTVLQPETNLAFEIGVKTSWMNDKLQMDAAAFSYNYKNMQVFALRPIAVGQPLASLEENAGKAQDRGGEIELKAAPTKDWLITGSVGYVHAVFTEFDTFTNAGAPLSLAGNRIPRQPQWTASSLVQYRFYVWSGASIRLQTDWNYRSDYYVNPDNANNPLIPGRTIGNVRATYSPANDRWEVSLWSDNVTDKIYPIGGYSLGFINSQIFYDGYPRTYGISAKVNFL